jgi:hypothetical protein
MTLPHREMLYALDHLTSNNDNGESGGGRCCIYVGPPGSATFLVRRIRSGLVPPSPRLTLFAILIAVTSALGMTTTTMTMTARTFVGTGKSCP